MFYTADSANFEPPSPQIPRLLLAGPPRNANKHQIPTPPLNSEAFLVTEIRLQDLRWDLYMFAMHMQDWTREIRFYIKRTTRLSSKMEALVTLTYMYQLLSTTGNQSMLFWIKEHDQVGSWIYEAFIAIASRLRDQEWHQWQAEYPELWHVVNTIRLGQDGPLIEHLYLNKPGLKTKETRG
ncbi:hypothetical protein BD324DRAFT_626971 [Kockovaella imperatae]|uniref:Uncharacterized protein n=1 Tax=Kockovaella imperatae TaxID=4999 RepID=A0A1Y1UFD1_9TREE|nr:hypothetical protein BD324DRAFT_626971 [Kockovaella imperatae]ORX36732.1 hypothetical protein BD324DRAFT_626971 [Kockovaella imperatae]